MKRRANRCNLISEKTKNHHDSNMFTNNSFLCHYKCRVGQILFCISEHDDILLSSSPPAI